MREFLLFSFLFSFLSIVWAAIVCSHGPFTLPASGGGTTTTCGTGETFNSTINLCCLNVPDVPGTRGQEYCDVAAKVLGMNRCPSTHPYNANKDMCCGPTPITREQREAAAQVAQAEAGGNPLGALGGSCVDKAPPGRASDCPANANLCNNALYYNLMTEQCPATCGRCTLAQNGAGPYPANCVDGVNSKGVSECPQNAFKCNWPVWRDFMRKECPRTCNACVPAPPLSPTGSGASI